MQIRVLLLAVCFALVFGCSKTPDSDHATASQAELALPATLEGNLSINVSNDWGYFGDITVNGAEYLVSIPADIFEASGVQINGGRVRVVIGAKEKSYDNIYYYASSIMRL